ncbi:MAG: four helix bundle protein [Acidimicrobiia bacterium]|nr:four helix bundle protein [Acidimicrobiia bacterium]
MWVSARVLTKRVCEVTGSFPSREQFALTSQRRAAATSIGVNIAEGVGRSSARDAARFIDIAIGSMNEVEQHLITAQDMGYLSGADATSLARMVSDVRKMLTGLHRTIQGRRS